MEVGNRIGKLMEYAADKCRKAMATGGHNRQAPIDTPIHIVNQLTEMRRVQWHDEPVHLGEVVWFFDEARQQRDNTSVVQAAEHAGLMRNVMWCTLVI